MHVHMGSDTVVAPMWSRPCSRILWLKVGYRACHPSSGLPPHMMPPVSLPIGPALPAGPLLTIRCCVGVRSSLNPGYIQVVPDCIAGRPCIAGNVGERGGGGCDYDCYGSHTVLALCSQSTRGYDGRSAPSAHPHCTCRQLHSRPYIPLPTTVANDWGHRARE